MQIDIDVSDRAGATKRGHHPSRGSAAWERATNPKPRSSTATPAATNTTRGSADGRRASAAKTITHPASSKKKPASFMKYTSDQISLSAAIRLVRGPMSEENGACPQLQDQEHLTPARAQICNVMLERATRFCPIRFSDTS